MNIFLWYSAVKNRGCKVEGERERERLAGEQTKCKCSRAVYLYMHALLSFALFRGVEQ